MTYVVIYLIVMVFGIVYAWRPEWSLRRKYPHGEIPRTAMIGARVVGVLLAVAGAAGAAYMIWSGI